MVMFILIAWLLSSAQAGLFMDREPTYLCRYKVDGRPYEITLWYPHIFTEETKGLVTCEVQINDRDVHHVNDDEIKRREPLTPSYGKGGALGTVDAAYTRNFSRWESLEHDMNVSHIWTSYLKPFVVNYGMWLWEQDGRMLVTKAKAAKVRGAKDYDAVLSIDTYHPERSSFKFKGKPVVRAYCSPYFHRITGFDYKDENGQYPYLKRKPGWTCDDPFGDCEPNPYSACDPRPN